MVGSRFLVCVAVLSALVASAWGHMWLVSPLARGGSSDIGGTSGPCNGKTAGSGTVATYTGGAQVQFQFRVNQHGPDPFNFKLTTSDDSTLNGNSSAVYVLVANIPNTVTTSATNGFEGVNVAVTIPNITCNACTVQLSGMGNNGAGTWYSCADVKIIQTTGSFPLPNSLTPKSGPVWGGSTVTVIGSNFGDSASSTISCKFGKIEVAGTWVSSTQINCPVPPTNTPGTVSLEVSLDSGVTYSLSGLTFVYVGNAIVPSITSISPTSGVAGTSISITGTGFFSTNLYCLFFKTQVRATIVSSTSATCTVPTIANQASVPVEVSVDGQIYSQSGVSFSFSDQSPALRVLPSLALLFILPILALFA